MWKRSLVPATKYFSTSSSSSAVAVAAAGTKKNSRAFGWWDHVKPAPKDPILSVTEDFLADASPHKINLGVGAYMDEHGRPIVLQCVQAAEAYIAANQLSELLSSDATSKLVEQSVKLVYGKNSDAVKEGKFAGIQALSGTGACRLFAEFQKRLYPDSVMYLPDPTWSNHHNIWNDAEVRVRTFRYYNSISKGLDFPALLEDIKNAPEKSFFLLHPCAHNPTGIDPTEDEWRQISYHLKAKNHFPFFDVAYQGLASGDLENDAKAIKIFIDDGHLTGCAQSFAKIMGLVGHRVGCLSILSCDEIQATAIESQLNQIARAMYSKPPAHGMILVSKILCDPKLRLLWESEMKVMTNRIMRMRACLRRNLEKLGSHINWEHITNQVGMFCFSGLSTEQVVYIAKNFHVYITHDGRISMAGVTEKNVEYLAKAMHAATKVVSMYKL